MSPPELPRAARDLLLRMFTATMARHERDGTSPVFVASHLLQDVGQALDEVGGLPALDRLFDALGVDDLGDERLKRPLERTLTAIGRYVGTGWRYPDVEAVFAAFESTFAVRWVEPEPQPMSVTGETQPPPGAAVVRYGAGETPVVGGWLAHPKLGTGVVVAVAPTKVTVRFADRERVLVRR